MMYKNKFAQLAQKWAIGQQVVYVGGATPRFMTICCVNYDEQLHILRYDSVQHHAEGAHTWQVQCRVFNEAEDEFQAIQCGKMAADMDSNVSPEHERTRSALIIMMRDLHENATDTVWLTKFETAFDRLVSIYLDAGGSQDELKKHFPQYFD